MLALKPPPLEFFKFLLSSGWGTFKNSGSKGRVLIEEIKLHPMDREF